MRGTKLCVYLELEGKGTRKAGGGHPNAATQFCPKKLKGGGLDKEGKRDYDYW